MKCADEETTSCDWGNCRSTLLLQILLGNKSQTGNRGVYLSANLSGNSSTCTTQTYPRPPPQKTRKQHGICADLGSGPRLNAVVSLKGLPHLMHAYLLFVKWYLWFQSQHCVVLLVKHVSAIIYAFHHARPYLDITEPRFTPWLRTRTHFPKRGDVEFGLRRWG